MDEKMREAVGLKKFSVIAPAVNRQVESLTEYFAGMAGKPLDMPYLGLRKYSAKTLMTWYYQYNRYGLDGLVKAHRSDKGKRRKISGALGERIVETRRQHPKMPVSVLYEQLVGEGALDPTAVSLPTVYRYIDDMGVAGAFKGDGEGGESRRFSHEHVGDLYQADVLYGPSIKIGGRNCPTYLHMILDDCSRYPVHSQFYLSQNFETLRHCFKEAVLRRGVPRLMYTDNGRIYRSQNFEFICASLGCTLLHSQPFVPQGRGKVERMFGTVRRRFLSTLDAAAINGIDHLNELYFKWLDEDYCRKAHRGLDGLTPHDVLMSQAGSLRLITDRALLDEIFLYRVTRKVGHDATLSIDCRLYETDQRFAGRRVEIRYDPEWVGSETVPLPIFEDGKKVGEARLVRFHDNAHAKRKGAAKTGGHAADTSTANPAAECVPTVPQENPISYSDFLEGSDSNV